jgi:hypothetical protein
LKLQVPTLVQRVIVFNLWADLHEYCHSANAFITKLIEVDDFITMMRTIGDFLLTFATLPMSVHPIHRRQPQLSVSIGAHISTP